MKLVEREIAKHTLATLTEVHEFYEFEARTDKQVDDWLHLRIKQWRRIFESLGGKL
jgi:hypothetical protein